jgi:hypothetical protein
VRRARLLASGAALTVAVVGITGCGLYDTNSYWYCWDKGAKSPHHLGHHVDGDHLCSDAELKGTGFSPRS